MSILAVTIAKHTSRDDPKTTFEFNEIQGEALPRWEVECLKETIPDTEWVTHWCLSFRDKDKAEAEFNRWLTS